MSTLGSQQQRIVSGMRTTGSLHLGHYKGVLENWIKLQHEYECFFFAADWHALTTHYDDPHTIADHTHEMIIDWLAAGIDPNSCNLFVQSKVPEHAELHLLLSMITPVSWLERVPTYKDQQEALKEKDLATYGFLGYPVLQTADVLIYKATSVPVGEDQVPHLEISREIARRFNHLYGREPGFEDKVIEAVSKMGKKNAKLFAKLLKSYQELGDKEALERGQALLESQSNINTAEKERLSGYLEGTGRVILPEPHALLTPNAKMPGLDGQKMSKSYGNTLGMRQSPDEVRQKLQVMPTDTARIRRTDPGSPDKCPVWPLHSMFSDSETQAWVKQGCQSAGIGCLDCKGKLADAIIEVQAPFIERAGEYIARPGLVKDILQQGADKARDVARDTLEEVRDVMGLGQ